MVDPDRLDDLVGEEEEEKSKSKKKSRRRSTGNKKERVDKMNTGSGGGVSKKKAGSGTEDVKRLLFCIANMDAYTRIVAEAEFDEFNQSQSVIKEEFARDTSGEIVNFLGVFNVRDVCTEYGYSWDNIMETTIDRNDLLGETLQTNSGNPNKSELKDLLDCVANILLFVEGNLRDKQSKDKQTQRDATIEVVSENIYDRFTEIVSRTEVQNIAERNGFDWQNDIIQGVLSDQDFESRVKE